MMFVVRPNLLWVIVATCAIGALAWIWLEFRRPNRRQWLARILAAFLATLALTVLGLRPAWPGAVGPPRVAEQAALWTPSMTTDANGNIPREVNGARMFAFAGVSDKPANALVVPDLAFLRREFPQVNVLHVFGDGLSVFDTDAVRGLRIIFHAPDAKPTAPGLAFVRLPREVTLGSPVVVQGLIEGIASLPTPALNLVTPDGTAKAVPLTPTDDGSASFTATVPTAAAVGRFVWTLELRAGDQGAVLFSERFGVSVVPPNLPRVLVIESSPRFDSGRLKRWLGERGAMLATRTKLSRDLFRISALNGAREEIEVLDQAAVDAFDLVLADARAIAKLTEPERDVFNKAVRDRGLGLLIIADETILTKLPSQTPDAKTEDFLSPWKLARDAGSPDEEDRLSRLQWSGSDLVPVEPLPVPPVEIARQNGQRPLVRDGQGRALVVATGRGRGQMALTLVRETWRWPQAGDAGAFAGFWSFLMSELTRPDLEFAGHWDVTNGSSGPLIVDQPIGLQWTGSPDRAPMPGQVTWEGAPDATPLPLAQDESQSTRWQTTYWPRHAGWHHVSSPGGGRDLDFLVSESSAWPTLRAHARTAATERMAAFSTATPEVPTRPAPSGAPPIEPWRGWFFALFFACLTYLWLESRSRLATKNR